MTGAFSVSMLKNKLGGGKSGLRKKVGSCGGGQVRSDGDLGWKAAAERKSSVGLQAAGCAGRLQHWGKNHIETRRRFRAMTTV